MLANITFGCRLRDLTSCVIDDVGGDRPLGEGGWLDFGGLPEMVLAGSGDVALGGAVLGTRGREAAMVAVAGSIRGSGVG